MLAVFPVGAEEMGNLLISPSRELKPFPRPSTVILWLCKILDLISSETEASGISVSLPVGIFPLVSTLLDKGKEENFLYGVYITIEKSSAMLTA